MFSNCKTMERIENIFYDSSLKNKGNIGEIYEYEKEIRYLYYSKFFILTRKYNNKLPLTGITNIDNNMFHMFLNNSTYERHMKYIFTKNTNTGNETPFTYPNETDILKLQDYKTNLYSINGSSIIKDSVNIKNISSQYYGVVVLMNFNEIQISDNELKLLYLLSDSTYNPQFENLKLHNSIDTIAIDKHVESILEKYETKPKLKWNK